MGNASKPLRFLTTADVARQLQWHDAVVTRFFRQGKIKAWQISRRDWRTLQRYVNAFIRRRDLELRGARLPGLAEITGGREKD